MIQAKRFVLTALMVSSFFLAGVSPVFADPVPLSGQVKTVFDEPLPGVVFEVYSLEDDSLVVAETVDAEGRFSVELPSDPESPTAYRIAYVPPENSRYIPYQEEIDISGQTEIDLDVVPLARLTTISGTVTDLNDEPVAGATIRFVSQQFDDIPLWQPYLMDDSVSRGDVITDETGQYSIELIEYSYLIEELLIPRKPAVPDGDSVGSLEEWAITTAFRNDPTFDIQLPVKDVTFTVEDADGNPVTEGNFTIYKPFSNEEYALVPTSLGTFEARVYNPTSNEIPIDTPSTERIIHVENGSYGTFYEVGYYHESCADGSLGDISKCVYTDIFFVGNDFLFEIPLHQEVELSGTVRYANTQGITGLRIRGDFTDGPLPYSAITGPEGQYTIGEATGNRQYDIDFPDNTSDHYTRGTFWLPTPVALNRTAIDLTTPIRPVTVRVEDATGEPIPDADVNFYAVTKFLDVPTTVGTGRGVFESRQIGVTSAQGVVEFELLQGATYPVEVFADGYDSFSSTKTIDANTGTVVITLCEGSCPDPSGTPTPSPSPSPEPTAIPTATPTPTPDPYAMYVQCGFTVNQNLINDIQTQGIEQLVDCSVRGHIFSPSLTQVVQVLVGIRSDGKPMAWEVTPSNDIRPLRGLESAGSVLPLPDGCHPNDHRWCRSDGWEWEPTGISDDGRVIALTATNATGTNYTTCGPNQFGACRNASAGATVGSYIVLSQPFYGRIKNVGFAYPAVAGKWTHSTPAGGWRAHSTFYPRVIGVEGGLITTGDISGGNGSYTIEGENEAQEATTFELSLP
jgi:hypothetical protein